MTNLQHWTWPHQIEIPWGQQTASFHVGAQGIERIYVDDDGVVVVEQTQYQLLFMQGGWGWRERAQEPAAPVYACEECGKVAETAQGLAAHKRSHQANHRGQE